MTYSPSSKFLLSTDANKRLDRLVDKIESNPGELISPGEFDELRSRIDLGMVLEKLPRGLNESDLVGILKLALLTECATDTYSNRILRCAEQFDVSWLSRFTNRVWRPDEATHFAPYKLILMNLGFAERELDREMKETRERAYVHYGGDTPVHMTTFGIIQEYLTDSWHGLISNMLRPASPQASYMALRIKRRETLHCAWYRDMTALQIEDNPKFVSLLAEQVHQFHMPSMSLAPELHGQGFRWQQGMGADFEAIFRDLFRLVQQTFGSVRQTGELVMSLASAKRVKIGPLSGRLLADALNRLGGPGYGIIGEAALERVGLDYLFKNSHTHHDSAFLSYAGVHERIRGLVRTWIASQLPPPAVITLGIPIT